MKILSFTSLPQAAGFIRQKVFVEEQGFEYEFDSIDDVAIHFVLFSDEETPIATCRVFWNEEKSSYILGRLAVIKEYREKGLGRALVEAVEKYVKEMGGNLLQLHAQCRITSFYEHLGFVPFGDIEDEEDCPHIWMKKRI